MSKPITFEVKKTIEIVDADKVPILKGSVLQHIDDEDCRGVVTRIALPGMQGYTMECAGDIHVRTGPGCARVSSKYHTWRHIPHDEQTYEERYLSWLYHEFWYDKDSSISKDEQFAMSGIIALLPENAIKWETHYPNDFQDSLEYLMKHLMELKEQINELQKNKN